ncbi:membrane lipoprotein lipid attachment site-containing protein [Culicoidibacter larvae]|uniref:Uncharacterized protein n=1 Tax=Culicoidibacter larvae TaxID=2579976 RepID=A0A5R8QF54_9FIRM|nr:membrane lipoprotein lipid attachment site-containing protein [Culicoidibacter larvae]TLG76669.1 hypothetical protein FEZ08_03385 [Culicoidibacter larvae]
MKKIIVVISAGVLLLSGCAAAPSAAQILADNQLITTVANHVYVPNKENNFFLYYLPKGYIEREVSDNNAKLASSSGEVYIHVNPNHPDMSDRVDMAKVLETKVINSDVTLYILSTNVENVYSVVFTAPFARVSATLKADDVDNEIDYLTIIALSIQVKPAVNEREFIGENQQQVIQDSTGSNEGVLQGPSD